MKTMARQYLKEPCVDYFNALGENYLLMCVCVCVTMKKKKGCQTNGKHGKRHR